MKILQVIDRLNIGGAERVLVDLSNLLHEHQYNVSVLFLLYPGPMKQELHPDIPRLVLNRKYKYSLISLYKCATYVKKFDIIHCHHQYVFNYIKLACKLFGVKKAIILHDHGPNREPDHSYPIFKPNYYIGVSSQLIQWANGHFKLPTTNTFLLPNTIRRKNDITAAKKYDLILVSNIKPEKNLLFAVELAIQMQRDLLIVGNIQDKHYYEELKHAAANSTIEFITDSTDARHYIAQAKFGLHTSTSETGPLVLLEYMTCGIPFLSFNTGEVAMICKDQYSDFFIQNQSITDWISRIEIIQNKGSSPNELQSFFDHHFGEQQYFSKCRKIYTQISQDYSL